MLVKSPYDILFRGATDFKRIYIYLRTDLSETSLVDLKADLTIFY